MGKKEYNKARKNRYNLVVFKGEDARHKIDLLEENKPDGFCAIRNREDMKKSAIKSAQLGIAYMDAVLAHNREYMTEDTKEALETIESRNIVYNGITGWEITEDAEKADNKKYYVTLADWLAEKDGSLIYVPIHCYLWKFCRTQKTREAVDCMEYTDKGKKKPSDHYEDYVQTIACILVEMALDNPNDSFSDALYIATKKGLNDCFKTFHHVEKEKQEDGTRKNAVNDPLRLDAPIKEDDPKSATLKESLPVAYSKPLDAEMIEKETIEFYKGLVKESEKETIFSLADGYTVKEISDYTGDTPEAIYKRRNRCRDRIRKELRKASRIEKEISSMLSETENKPETARMPETWKFADPDKLRIDSSLSREYYKPEAPHAGSNTIKEFENMVKRPTVKLVVTEAGKRSKREYINGYGRKACKVKQIMEAGHKSEYIPTVSKGGNDWIPDARLARRIAQSELDAIEIARKEAKYPGYYAKLYAGIGNGKKEK